MIRARSIRAWVLAFDLIWAAIAFVASFVIRYGIHGSAAARTSILALSPFFVATCATWAALSYFVTLDGFRGGWRLSAVVSHVLAAMFCTMAVLLALAYLARTYVSRLALLNFGLLLLAGFIAIRCIGYSMMRSQRQKHGVWRIVVVGTGRLAHELAEKFERHPETLCSVAGMLFPDESSAEDLQVAHANPHTVTLSPLEVADYLREQKVNEVVLAVPYTGNPEFRNFIDRCRQCDIRISIVPELYELYVTKPHFLDLDGLPVLQLTETQASSVYSGTKRVLDLVLTSLFAVPALVILLPVAVYLWLRGRPALREEPRSGCRGKPFSMLRLNIDRPAGASIVGRTLEALGITELPQLWNVLRGDMSLVGPRPEPPSRVQNYSEWQYRRLEAVPGITGLAQVHGLREQNSSEEKTKLDLQYLMHRSPLMDFSILLQTFWTLGKRMVRLSRPAPPAIPGSNDNDPNQSSEEAFSSAHRSQPSED